MRTDVYEKITNQIVSELEKGVRPLAPAVESRASPLNCAQSFLLPSADIAVPTNKKVSANKHLNALAPSILEIECRAIASWHDAIFV
jgi:antirestriction protein ArdC